MAGGGAPGGGCNVRAGRGWKASVQIALVVLGCWDWLVALLSVSVTGPIPSGILIEDLSYGLTEQHLR